MLIHHAIETAGFLAVALNRVLDRPRRGAQKVMHLAEHRSDAAHLKHQPLNRLEAFRLLLWQKAAGFVRQVQQDGAGLEQGIRLAVRTVAIDNRGDLAVRVDGNKARRELLAFADINRVRGVGQRQFLQQDRHLAAVRRAPRVQIDQRRLRMDV